MDSFIGFIVVAVFGFYIFAIVIAAGIDRKNKEKFDDTLARLRASGYKIRYSNRTTGTISYIDRNGCYTSISVFRGYNSHYKG